MILIINTADTKKVFIGLTKDNKLVAKKQFIAQYQQAEKLLPEIDKLLQATSYKFTPQNPSKARICAGLKAIIVVSGPGPFTALRIGVITANTLAWALKIPVAGIKLNEFKNINELIKKANNKLKNKKVGDIVEPFYNKEPNITKRKK